MAKSESELLAIAQTTWGIVLKHKGRGEWCGPCPFCHVARKDGFLVWTEGNGRYWCRQCDAQGFLDALDGARKPSSEQIAQFKREREEQRLKEAQTQAEALAYMKVCRDHIRYHDQVTGPVRQWWRAKGLSDSTILDYQLGFCQRCPTDKEGRASYTIPITYQGQLQNIRHRLNTDGGDKYRPHRAHLGLQLFHADLLADPVFKEPVLVEGEIKAMVLLQYGVPAVGIPGARGFLPEWFKLFGQARRVFLALDPGVKKQAWALGKQFSANDIEARVLNLVQKPDDMFVDGLDVDVFYSFMRCARKVP